MEQKTSQGKGLLSVFKKKSNIKTGVALTLDAIGIGAALTCNPIGLGVAAVCFIGSMILKCC